MTRLGLDIEREMDALLGELRAIRWKDEVRRFRESIERLNRSHPYTRPQRYKPDRVRCWKLTLPRKHRHRRKPRRKRPINDQRARRRKTTYTQAKIKL